MARELDQILVVDVESTCWENKPPKGQENEIIEIGICTVDVTKWEIVSNSSMLVVPEKSQVSEFCTRLTTLTQKQVMAGVPFKEACKVLSNAHNSKNRTWASWGDYDRRQFERQCKDRTISYPFGPTHINVKNLHAIISGLTREVGMSAALEELGMKLSGTHHRGIDDARNIAKILIEHLKE